MSSRYRSRIVWVLILASVSGTWTKLSAQTAPIPFRKPQLVASIEFKGLKNYTPDQLLSMMSTRVGTDYKAEVMQQDLEKIRSTHWFRDSDLHMSSNIDSDGQIHIQIFVTELAQVIKKIVYLGAQHLSEKELNEITGLRVGMKMSPQVNQSAAKAIWQKYISMERINASVELLKGTKETDQEVVFRIVEGMKPRITDIQFKFLGPQSGKVSIGRLRSQLKIGRGIPGVGGKFDQMTVDDEDQKLRDYYAALGFIDVRVRHEIIWNDDHRTATIIFYIQEGQRYRVGDVKVQGNSTFNENTLLQVTNLRPQEFYDEHAAKMDGNRIADYYGYTGREARVRQIPAPDPENPGVVNVTYEVEERGVSYIKNIVITGNERTQDRIIRRQLNLFPGQILSYPELRMAEENLNRLGLFKNDPANGIRPSVSVLNPELDDPWKTVQVQVEEQPTGSFMVGVGVNSNIGLLGNIALNERNFDLFNFPTSFDDLLSGNAFRGAGQELRIQASPGTLFQQYSVSLREPSLFDGPYGFTVSGYYNQYYFLEYAEKREGGRFSLSRQLDRLWSVSDTVRVENVNVSNILSYTPWPIAKYQGNNFQVGNRVDIARDSRDNYLRPTSGTRIDFGAEEITGDYTFPILTMDATGFLTTYSRPDGSGKHVLALHSMINYTNSNAPVYERFYGGGYHSIRGFSWRGVGPHVGAFNIGGDFAILNSLEYQIPILANDNLFAVGFVDSGTVESQVAIRDYRVTVGVGLRIALPQLFGPVPIALDFGFPVNQAPGDVKQIFNFWMGFFN